MPHELHWLYLSKEIEDQKIRKMVVVYKILEFPRNLIMSITHQGLISGFALGLSNSICNLKQNKSLLNTVVYLRWRTLKD